MRLRHLYYSIDAATVSVMELRHLRYFVAVGEEQHYGRAARRLRVAQPALSRQIQDLEQELGFTLFDRLPRGVKLSAPGVVFLEEARRILTQVSEASARAHRVAAGQIGTLRVGFLESMSWHGLVPDSFRSFREQQPNATLQIRPMASLDQITAVHAGHLDAGFIFTIADIDRDLSQLKIGSIDLMLAAPKGHAFANSKSLRLGDLVDAPFIWFPRSESPLFYDQLMRACYRGGLKFPRIVQEGVNEATILSLVSCGLGVAFVSAATQWRVPHNVVLKPIADLHLALPFALVSRSDNTSPLLQNFFSTIRTFMKNP